MTVGEYLPWKAKSNLKPGGSLGSGYTHILQGGFMDKHVLPTAPPTAFDGNTGMRLAPPGLLQVDRWKHLTEKPVAAPASPALAKPPEDR